MPCGEPGPLCKLPGSKIALLLPRSRSWLPPLEEHGYNEGTAIRSIMDYIINVALINRPLTAGFDYQLSLPDDAPPPCPGARVLVPFGSSKDNTGVILSVQSPAAAAPAPAARKLKQAQLTDRDCVLGEDVFELCRWAAAYYHYPQGLCFFTALPSLLRAGREAEFKSLPAVALNPDFPADYTFKNELQQRLFSMLKNAPQPLFRQEIKDRGISTYALRALIKKGAAVETTRRDSPQGSWQETAAERSIIRTGGPALNVEQQAAADAVINTQDFAVFMLNGITGSGKTEVYLTIIAAVLQRGQAALVLVPEIALTPQTVERFYQRFAVPVVLMHSALSDADRLNAWLMMKHQKAAVLVGTRSALFTPIPHLGLIVIDEEHDSSFKQGDGLRYHTRTLAEQRARLNHCPLLLGSATPSMESLYAVQQGDYIPLYLTHRAGPAEMPALSLIDLRTEPLTQGLLAGIGQTLEDEIGLETVRGNQVLLFLNRRGYAHQLMCHQCGLLFTCPHCDNILTVHKAGHKLSCHICDCAFALPDHCPQCHAGRESLIENGFGTEQIEEFLKKRYPDVGVERIDRDSVSGKSDLEVKLGRIRRRESMILVGTQMLAKGHDFPDVTLVGIIDIDGGLFSDDFRAQEYTAQLLTQVAGRSGRAEKPGRVLIQTHHPDNLLLNQLIDPNLSYSDLISTQLALRQQLQLPPVTCQAYLLANSLQREKAHRFLLELQQALQPLLSQLPEVVLGLVLSDKIEKRHNRYHFHLQVTSCSRSSFDDFLSYAVTAAAALKSGDGVRFAVDVDPLTMY